EIEHAHKAGKHKEAQERLEVYAKEEMGKLVSEKNLLLAQDLKNKYEALNEKLVQAKKVLQNLPKLFRGAGGDTWKGAADMILGELNYDTLPRLETFLVFAQQHERELAETKAKPTQATDEVMALAVSGWLLGNASAEPDVK